MNTCCTILHIIPYLSSAQGGPVESLRLLAAVQAELGHQVRIVHTGRSRDGPPVRFTGKIEVFKAKSYLPFRWAPNLFKTVFYDDFQPDVIHSHGGLWLDANRKAHGLTAKLGIPHILSPCGMLQPDALLRSKWKKKAAWLAFQKRVLASASLLHAKSEAEASSIEKLFPKARIEIIPNPIEPVPDDFLNPDINRRIYKDSFLARFNIPRKNKIALYLGRLHPVKGPERLIRVWMDIHSSFKNWTLVLVGPDENGYQNALESLVGKLSQQKPQTNRFDSVRILGPMYGNARWQAYAAADIVVVPSDFENFGQTVAEALSMKVPVITTTGTPWKVLEERGCGWWVDPTHEGLAIALKTAMRIDDAERKTMGEEGRHIVEKYTPVAVAEKFNNVYASLI